MTGHQRIRAALVGLLRKIPGIGVVHDYERFSTKPNDFQRLYMQDKNVLGFYLRRQSWRETKFCTTHNTVRTRWVLKGFASLLDSMATELAFDFLLDTMASTLRKTPILFDDNGCPLCHMVTDEGGAGLQLDDSGPVLFAGVLCHSATFTLTTEHHEEKESFTSDPNTRPKDKNSNGQENNQVIESENVQSSKTKKRCSTFFRAIIDPANTNTPSVELIRPFAPEGEYNND